LSTYTFPVGNLQLTATKFFSPTPPCAVQTLLFLVTIDQTHWHSLAVVNVGIWLQQSSGSVFYLFTSPGATSRGRLQEVVGPATVDDLWTANSVTFSTFSATPDALCGLMTDGRLFVRTGMGSHCPTGVSWSPVNLPDLGLCYVVVFCYCCLF